MKGLDNFLKSSSQVVHSLTLMHLESEQRETRRREAEQYKTTTLIHGVSYEGIAYCEAIGFSKILASYASNCAGETIEAIGFNLNSGYTYLALENGVQLVSSRGQDVEYLTVRSADGCELWHDSYADALASPYIEEEEDEEEVDWIDNSDSDDF